MYPKYATNVLDFVPIMYHVYVVVALDTLSNKMRKQLQRRLNFDPLQQEFVTLTSTA